MANIILPQRWQTKPPLGAQINWGHPLSNGLIGAFLFNGGGSSILNIAGKDTCTVNNGTPDHVSRGMLFESGDGCITTFSFPNNTDIYTFCARYSCTSTTPTNSRCLNGDNSGSHNWLLGPYQATYRVYNGSFMDSGIESRLYPVLHTVASDGASSYQYVGKLAAGSSVNSNPPGVVGLGVSGGYAESLLATMHELYVFSRALSFSEVQCLDAEPYAFIQPPAPYRRFIIPNADVPSYGPTGFPYRRTLRPAPFRPGLAR